MKPKNIFILAALFAAFVGSSLAQIIVSPSIPQVINVGAQVDMVATADGDAPFTFQWQKAGTDIPGATAAKLTIAHFAATDAAIYTVKISNSAGSVSTTATLTKAVTPPSNPKISLLAQIVAWFKAIFGRMFA